MSAAPISLRGERLRESREQKKLTQRQLAQLCGVTEFQISRYENSKSDISGKMLQIIAQTLDVSADYLLGLSHEPRGKVGDSELSEEEHNVVTTLRRDGWPGLLRMGADRMAK